MYSCSECIEKHFSVYGFTRSKKCHTEFEAEIQEALVVKQQNSKLNRQLYASDSSFLLNVY